MIFHNVHIKAKAWNGCKEYGSMRWVIGTETDRVTSRVEHRAGKPTITDVPAWTSFNAI
jgi:hypothetical protein